jgi:uncharacterized protein
MLLVKTRLSPSTISGIGLHADEFIPKGTIIWEFSPGIDLKFTPYQHNLLKKFRNFEAFDRYFYKSIISDCFILCADDGRFINHSNHPNTIDTPEREEGLTIALRDIQRGEEITSNYASFDGEYEDYKHLLIK